MKPERSRTVCICASLLALSALTIIKPAPPGDPPSDAIVLLGPSFDAAALAARWTNRKDPLRKAPPPWKVKDGVVTVEPGSGDLVTVASFGDVQVHLEWALQPLDKAAGGAADTGNSGIKFHEVYEIQIIDSYGKTENPAGLTGAVYKQHAPLVNACRERGAWETFDIIFRPPRFEGGKLAADGRFTVFQNGVLIQDNVKILGRTNDAQPMPQEYRRPFFLQDHGDRVRFRNVWVRPLEPRAD
jgi:hypothetical protein